jgi:hypothetical protein
MGSLLVSKRFNGYKFEFTQKRKTISRVMHMSCAWTGETDVERGPSLETWFYVKFKQLKHSFLLESFLKMRSMATRKYTNGANGAKKRINEIVKYGSKAET